MSYILNEHRNKYIFTEDNKEFGIEVEHNCLTLPIKLDREESAALAGELLSWHEKRIDEHKWYASLGEDLIQVYLESNWESVVNVKKSPYGMMVRTKRSREFHQETTVINKVIKDTILGKKLKEYWIKEDGIGEEEAEERMEYITTGKPIFTEIRRNGISDSYLIEILERRDESLGKVLEIVQEKKELIERKIVEEIHEKGFYDSTKSLLEYCKKIGMETDAVSESVKEEALKRIDGIALRDSTIIEFLVECETMGVDTEIIKKGLFEKRVVSLDNAIDQMEGRFFVKNIKMFLEEKKIKLFEKEYIKIKDFEEVMRQL